MESNIYWLLLMFFFTICQSSNNENKNAKDTLHASKKNSQKRIVEKLWVDKGTDYEEIKKKKIPRRTTIKFTQH